MESEAFKIREMNEAQGRASAILAIAEANALSIERIAKSLKENGIEAQNAVSLSIAEKYLFFTCNL